MLAVASALSVFVPVVAHAEPWLCPSCLEQVIDRDPESPVLDCPACSAHYEKDELSWVIGYANYRTRPIDLNYLLLPPDCDRFREDGLETIQEDQSKVWVPWIAIRYYIPRQRIVVLRDGREVTTEYAKTRGEPCPEPPAFQFDLVDTVYVDGEAPRPITRPVETDLAEIFFVAGTPELRDVARKRFIDEVEAGNHPRLPRTDARMVKSADLTLPKKAQMPEAEAEIEVRVNDLGMQLLRIHVLKSSGNPELDKVLVQSARRNHYLSAGEMGVPVPATLVLHYTIHGSESTVEARPAVPSIWEH
ncbi:MAG: energy transducer TonB [Candidatus Eisenbacteria bacterium]|uniref:Energy transducer TonB n=1 Tax=Eiseniibacteriota bacterium TaxID=2212470 RepID=A0A956LXS4_UNCEI|nr:energy transducer TonB [Candidatus Eisenbacteria bacterium]